MKIAIPIWQSRVSPVFDVAAKSLLEDEAARQGLEAAFILAAGSAQCRQIRKLRQLSCRQCVQAAADELFACLSAGQPLRRPAHCED